MKEMSEQFLRHSERLMRLSDGNEFYYDPREIQLAELILQNVLDSNSVSTAYGIKSAKTRMEIEKTVHKLQRTNGRLLASELFRFPEKQSGPLSNAKNKELVQILATSAHSCAMPLTFELMPTMSPHSDDFRGAIALYQNFVPQIQKIRTDQDAFKKGALDPSILIPSDGKDLTKMGVEPILRLRQTKEFRRLQLERKKLLDFYDSKNAGQLVVPEEMEQETAFGKALANYLARILEEYNLKWLPAENPESAVLKRLIYETDNKITEIMTEISTAGTLYAGVASVLTVLAAFGVVPLAMMLAGGGIVTAGVLNRRRVLKHLRSDRKDFNKASSLVNISKKHTS
ncbi:MAG: hypothetical protein DWG76_04075 [Chloroflexi bacterium]|nr:hypothetical protein [Chloroflexota bacterium]